MKSTRTAVFDTSAALAFFNQERGAAIVARLAARAAMSSVNLAEIATKMAEWEIPPAKIDTWIQGMKLQVVPFDTAQAMDVGSLRPTTRAFGLSLGDRACLALGRKLRVPVYTAESAWAGIDVGVRIELIR